MIVGDCISLCVSELRNETDLNINIINKLRTCDFGTLVFDHAEDGWVGLLGSHSPLGLTF
jgi:hypothetical protein